MPAFDSYAVMNVAYVLNFFALAVRDVLWLRVVLLPAQLSWLTWGSLTGNVATVGWNTVFISINVFQVIKILRERRPIALPSELADLHERVFPEMKPREFLLFWETGRLTDVRGERLIEEGHRPTELLLVVDGEARVVKDGRELARLKRGQFAAEMSFISREPASADVIADGELKYIGWSQAKLENLDVISPELSHKLQRILGRDVTAKIRNASGSNGGPSADSPS